MKAGNKTEKMTPHVRGENQLHTEAMNTRDTSRAGSSNFAAKSPFKGILNSTTNPNKAGGDQWNTIDDHHNEEAT